MFSAKVRDRKSKRGQGEPRAIMKGFSNPGPGSTMNTFAVGQQAEANTRLTDWCV